MLAWELAIYLAHLYIVVQLACATCCHEFVATHRIVACHFRCHLVQRAQHVRPSLLLIVTPFPLSPSASLSTHAT